MVFTVGVGLNVTERRPSGREGWFGVGSDVTPIKGVVSEVCELDAILDRPGSCRVPLGVAYEC